MEFWGVEVKPGIPVKCDPGFQKYLHLSQASFGEVKKDKSNDAVLSVKIGDQKLAIGILSAENTPQISFDLVFEKEFELSHNGKTSVHFCGYKASMEEDRPEFSDSEEESEEELDLPANGKPEIKQVQPKPAANKSNAAKPEPSAAKQKAQAGPIKNEKPVEDEDDDEDDEDEDDSDENMLGPGDESDSEDVDSDEDDEEDESSDEEATPKKAVGGIKRAAESASKTPAEKKAKLVTPAGQKTGGDGKKGVHVATPYPSKQAGKTPAANDKSKQQTPKSGGSVSCKSCNKSFNSENALQSHSKAKHSGK